MKPAFSNLNLRFNPFGELTQEERVRVAYANVDELLAQFKAAPPNTAIQFLADHGRGKTTHLLSLHRHFHDVPFVKLHGHSATQTIAPWLGQHDAQMIFVDSIENLTWFQRLKLYKRFSKLAFTTHRNLSYEMKLMGLSVHTQWVSQTNLECLKTVFNRRVDYARRTDGDVPWVTDEQISALQQHYGDDIRAMESALYAHYNDLNKKSLHDCSLKSHAS